MGFASWMVFSLLAVGLGGASAAPDARGALGDWKGPTDGVVRVYPCGGDVCLKLVKLPPDAASHMDGHNPDTALRTRPLCGMNIGTGFHTVDADHLEGGHIYDPVGGKTYKGTITAKGDQLDLRGYVGISMFGRSEKWKRVSPVDAAACR